jgi:hypothetical protein
MVTKSLLILAVKDTTYKNTVQFLSEVAVLRTSQVCVTTSSEVLSTVPVLKNAVKVVPSMVLRNQKRRNKERRINDA